MFSRFKKVSGPVIPRIPANNRVYCVGDIHAMVHLLQQLHAQIVADSCEYHGTKTIVYLGDYIDRGEHSKQVIDLLLEQPLKAFEPVYLQGNHEQFILKFIDDPVAAASWLMFGGREALNSYGIELAHLPDRNDLPELAKQLSDKLPDSHRAFLQDGRASWQCGSYYFVHAGIRPGVALQEQRLEDQLWIREEFMQSDKNHGVIVVHGHSIVAQPEVRENRISIDTGAFKTGVLTCLVLEGAEQRFLQTSG